VSQSDSTVHILAVIPGFRHPKKPSGFCGVGKLIKPGKKLNQILMFYATIIKKYFTRLTDINI